MRVDNVQQHGDAQPAAKCVDEGCIRARCQGMTHAALRAGRALHRKGSGASDIWGECRGTRTGAHRSEVFTRPTLNMHDIAQQAQHDTARWPQLTGPAHLCASSMSALSSSGLPLRLLTAAGQAQGQAGWQW